MYLRGKIDSLIIDSYLFHIFLAELLRSVVNSYTFNGNESFFMNELF